MQPANSISLKLGDAGAANTQRNLQIVRLNTNSACTVMFAEGIRRGDKSPQQVWMPAWFICHA
jgi:hypothetical protein